MMFSGLLLSALAGLADDPPPAPGPDAKPIFDGKTLEGWDGDAKWWRVEDGCITGGSLSERVPFNDFLCSTKRYTNFILRLKFKMSGTEGFINSGIQFRSERVPKSREMKGYQADIGDPDYWGNIYDESRRNKTLAASDMKKLKDKLKRGDWNEYVIRADGPRMTLWLAGVQTVDWTEPDEKIPDTGLFGIQIHGGGKVLVQVKDISIEELPKSK